MVHPCGRLHKNPRRTKNLTSQAGEDGIIEEILKILGSDLNPWCVELGAHDGRTLSNTYNLINSYHWNGVLIEEQQWKYKKLCETYQGNQKVFPINCLVGFDGDATLDNTLTKTSITENFGLLSIDVDGCDYYIWESMKNYRPVVVVIEYNPTIPNDIVFIQAKNMSVNQGSSLLALIELGKKKGYELIATTSLNAIFVIHELFHKFEIFDNHINKMRREPGSRIWQGYDGTVYTHNFQRLLWKGIDIQHEDLQVIPIDQRYYGAKKSE